MIRVFRRYYVAVIVLMACVIGSGAFFYYKRIQSTASEPMSTLDWQAAGIQLSYPTRWILQTWGTDPTTDQTLSFLTPATSTANGYFCVKLLVATSSNNAWVYPLKGGSIITNFYEGLVYLYQSTEQYEGHSGVQLWVTDKDLRSQAQLTDGDWLSASADYNCVQGDLALATLTVDQQEHTHDYSEVVDFLDSIAVQLSNLYTKPMNLN